jgi:hypothetical protein
VAGEVTGSLPSAVTVSTVDDSRMDEVCDAGEVAFAMKGSFLLYIQ